MPFWLKIQACKLEGVELRIIASGFSNITVRRKRFKAPGPEPETPKLAKTPFFSVLVALEVRA